MTPESNKKAMCILNRTSSKSNLAGSTMTGERDGMGNSNASRCYKCFEYGRAVLSVDHSLSVKALKHGTEL
jgi:hypothetical protein